MPRKQNTQIDKKLSTYRPFNGQRPYKQIAHFMLWAKVHLPGTHFDAKQIARATLGYPPNGRVNADQERVIKNSMSKAKSYLLEGADRGDGTMEKAVLLNALRIGHRCATSDDEATDKGLRQSFARVNSAKRGLARTSQAINPAGIQEPGNKRFYRAIGTSNALPSAEDDRIANLLPEKAT